MTDYQTQINSLTTRVSALDRAIAEFRNEYDPATVLDVSGAVDTEFQTWLATHSEFEKNWLPRSMLLPSGAQNGVNTFFTSPSGLWYPDSIEAFLNGVAMPESWVVNRTFNSFNISSAVPSGMLPNTLVSERTELRVSYAGILEALPVSPSGVLQSGYSYSLETSEDLEAGDFVNVYYNSIDSIECRLADASDLDKRAHGYVTSATSSGEFASIWIGGVNPSATISGGVDIPDDAVDLWLSKDDPGKVSVTASGYGLGELIQYLGNHIGDNNVVVSIGDAVEGNAEFQSVRTVTATGPVLRTDFTVLVDTSGGNITLTLPGINDPGEEYRIKCIDASNNCIIEGEGAELIDGALNYQLLLNQSITVVSDGTQWRIF